MVEFLVVDKPSIYNAILGRPTLNGLKAVVPTYFLAMKIPTLNEVGIFRGNQEMARKCYVEAVNKVSYKVPQPAVVTTTFKINEINTLNSEIKPLSDLNPRVSEEEIRAQSVEDLVPYHLDHEYPDRSVLLGSKLQLEIQAGLEQFLRKHKDVFAWSHDDMPGINPAVMYHQLCLNQSIN